jgi:glycosyltransferase involved in cell wall biosynthesis
VLIIAYEVPPCGGSVQRVAKFIKYLPASGWEPIVLSTRVENYGVTDPSLMQEIIGAEISRAGWIRLGAWLRRTAARASGNNVVGSAKRESGIARLYQHLQAWNQLPDWAVGWIAPAVLQGIYLVRKTDIAIIYSVSPPYSAHIVGLVVSALTGRPWVADLRDQWIEDSERRLPTRFHQQFHARLESIVMHRADRVVTTTRRMTADVQERYPKVARNRILTIMNGFDSADLPTGVNLNGKGFLVAHAGTFYAERTPEPLFQALQALRSRNQAVSRQLRLELYGPRDPRTLQLIRSFDLDNVVQHCGYVPHSEVLRRLAAANLLLLIVHNNDIGRIAIPAKVFEYLALRRPILTLAPRDSEVVELLREYNCSAVVEPDNVDGIANAIEHAYTEFAQGKEIPTSEVFVRNFERSELALKLAKLFCDVVGSTDRHIAEVRRG